MRRIVSHIFDQPDESVIGVFSDRGRERVTVLRLSPDEPLEALEARAFNIVGGTHLARLYRSAERAEPALDPSFAANVPARASMGEPGIGRIATRAELEHIGAIAIPPERII